MRAICLCTLAAALSAAGCASSKGESYVRADYPWSTVEKVAVIEVTGRVRGEPVILKIWRTSEQSPSGEVCAGSAEPHPIQFFPP